MRFKFFDNLLFTRKYYDKKFKLKSMFPIAIEPDKIGEYKALTKSGGGYFWDNVLEYRVWLHPELGAADLHDGNDYFYFFPTYELALDFHNKNKGSESPLVLVEQIEWINEPQPNVFIHEKEKRITEWRVQWLNKSRREKYN